MTEIHNNNNDLKSNKKIKYEISKPSYLIPSNADKLIKNIPDKRSNNLLIEEKGGLLSLNKNNLNNNNKKNFRFDKKQNSARKRIKDKDNKIKLKPKNSIEKKKLNNNHVKSPKIILKSPITKSKMHKRINSLHINGKENKKNLKTVNNKKDFNLNMINYYKEKINNISIDKNTITIDQSINQKENNNNNMSKNIDLAISSSNNLSFSSENKKSTKYDNSSLTNKIYNNPIHIDELEKNDLYFSFNNNYVSGSLSDNDRKKVNLKQNTKINNNTLSGKIASRAKNLNKILEENFNNLKIEIKEKEKEKNIKNEEKSYDKYDTLNSKNISINELVYNSINNGKKNYNSKNKLTKQKEKENKTLSSDLVQKKRNMQHKTASLNRSLDLRKKNKIIDNFIHNDLNNKNNNNVEKKTTKLFSKNDFR